MQLVIVYPTQLRKILYLWYFVGYARLSVISINISFVCLGQLVTVEGESSQEGDDERLCPTFGSLVNVGVKNGGIGQFKAQCP